MEDSRSYRCPPAWLGRTALAGGAVVAWMVYLALTSERLFDVVLAEILAVVAAAVTAAVGWRLVSRYTLVSPDGLTISRGWSTVFVPWARVGALRVGQSPVRYRRPGSGAARPALNDHALCFETDGTCHVLPYITSASGRVVKTEVAELNRIWRRDRGPGWVASPGPGPGQRPIEPERWGRAVLLVVSAEFVAVCLAVLLMDLGGRAEALSPSSGIGMIVFLTLLLAVPTAIGMFVRRRRAVVTPAPSQPMGKRQARPK